MKWWIALILLTVGVGRSDGALSGLLTSATNAASTNVTAIALAQIDSQSQSAANEVQSTETALEPEIAEDDISNNLPAITDEIGARLEENQRILASRPSLEALRALDNDWERLHDQLNNWRQSLTKRAEQVDSLTAEMAVLDKRWSLTSTNLGTNAPAALVQRVAALRQKIGHAEDAARARQATVLDLQGKISAQDERVAAARGAIEHTRTVVFNHLFMQDSPPLTSARFWEGFNGRLPRETLHSLSAQVRVVRAYVTRREPRFFLHAGIFIIILALLIWAGRTIRQRSQTEEGLRPAAVVFEIPIATALLLTLMLSPWIYPDRPRLLKAIIGAAILIPATVVLRKFIERRLVPVLSLLVIFYLVDQIRVVAESQQILARLLFLGETLAGAVFFAIMSRSARFAATGGANQPHPERALKKWAFLLVALFSFSFLSNVAGCVILSKLVGGAILSGAYLGLILVALLRITDALLATSLNIPPLARLKLVANNRAELQREGQKLLTWAAMAFWVYFMLHALSVWTPFYGWTKSVLTAQAQVGSVKLSLWLLLKFIIVMWGSLLVSRLIQFILREEVYPRVTLAPGLHYSISMMLRYLVLIVGFFVALVVTGFSLTHLTILAGALSVGLGFGLQNIVNNFVSGIILLFERPVKVGDVIQVDSSEGVVMRIGIRASVVRSIDGSEVIVPNGNFISNNVTNLTLSTDDLLVKVMIGVTPGPAVNTAELVKAFIDLAAAHPKVLKSPPPQCLLLNLTGGGLNFELRAWVAQDADWRQVRSDLHVAVSMAAATRNLVLK